MFFVAPVSTLFLLFPLETDRVATLNTSNNVILKL